MDARGAGARPLTRGAVLLCGVLIVAAILFAPKVTNRMADFEVYWTAASRARAAEPLYRVEDGHYQFKYLPAFAVLAAPIGLVPLQAAKATWFVTSIALLVAAIAISVSVLPERLRPRWLIVAAIVVAMGKFYAHELVLGQVNLLFVAVVLAALLAMRAGRETGAGLLLALAIVVKPYAAIFAPWLALRRRAASVAALALGLVVAVLLPAVVYGIEGTIDLHRGWWRTVTESTAPNLTNADNVSLAGMFSKWLGATPAVRTLTAVASVVLLLLAGAVVVRRRDVTFPDALDAAFLLTLIPLLSPQGWDYVFLIATPAIALLANYDVRLPPLLRVVTIAAVLVIGLSVYDVIGRDAYRTFMSLSIITWCFLVVVAALAALRIRAVA